MSDLVAAPVGGAASDVTAVANGTGVADWIALLKPRVVSLVVVTGAIGMAVAPGRLNPVLAITTVIAIALGAGAAGAINMWYDRDIDRKMRRTATRPVAAGRVDPDEALHYGIGLSALSVLMLGLATNIAAGAWLALSIAFYVFVYTMWLKRRTPQNIVIGGAAGAFPPIIGWVAVTGHLALMPILLFSIVFLWTPPHFWALSLYACGDYDRAGVPMLPGPRSATRSLISRSCSPRSPSIISLPENFPRPLSPAEAVELRRRQRGRNIALLIALVAVVVIFYALAIVKLGGH